MLPDNELEFQARLAGFKLSHLADVLNGLGRNSRAWKRVSKLAPLVDGKWTGGASWVCLVGECRLDKYPDVNALEEHLKVHPYVDCLKTVLFYLGSGGHRPELLKRLKEFRDKLKPWRFAQFKPPHFGRTQ